MMAVTRELAQRDMHMRGAPGRRSIVMGWNQQLIVCDLPPGHMNGPCNGTPARTCWQWITSCPVATPVYTRLCDYDLDGKFSNERNSDTRVVLEPDGFHLYGPAGVGDKLHYVPTHWRWADRIEPLSPVAERLLDEIARDHPLGEAFVPPAVAAAGQKLVTIDAAMAAVNAAFNDFGVRPDGVNRRVVTDNIRRRLAEAR